MIKIPASAPFPTPTIKAAGVTIPIAHGHAMINTATKESKPVIKLPKTRYHIANDATATDTTTGTNFAETESTNL